MAKAKIKRITIDDLKTTKVKYIEEVLTIDK